MNDRYSFYGEFGRYLPTTILPSNYDQSGFTLAAEVKRYFNPSKSTAKSYLSFQYLRGSQQYTRSDIIGYTDDFYEFISYDVTKQFHDFSLRYGILFVHKKRLVINPYAGFGLRRHNVDNSLSLEEEDLRISKGWANPHSWIHNNGKQTYVKIHLGIRIGLRIF